MLIALGVLLFVFRITDWRKLIREGREAQGEAETAEPSERSETSEPEPAETAEGG